MKKDSSKTSEFFNKFIPDSDFLFPLNENQNQENEIKEIKKNTVEFKKVDKFTFEARF